MTWQSETLILRPTMLHSFIEGNIFIAGAGLLIAFFLLAKSANAFVDSAIAIANRLNMPRMLIGIVLVSLGTTAPELTVSLVSALKDKPEMALGNAIGSVLCDDGLALPICAFMAAGAISIQPSVLRLSGWFLLAIMAVFSLFTLPDCTLSRAEGICLVIIFVAYMAALYIQHKKEDDPHSLDEHISKDHSAESAWKLTGIFVLSLVVLVISSDIIVTSATTIARAVNIPEFVIAVTMVALGTSIPEVATCVTAARKGEGALAVGNILGADVLNICWVAGASAIANNLTVHPPRQLYFMLPSMVIIVLVMLALLRHRHSLTRKKGATLFILYIVYLVASFALFPPTLTSAVH